MTGPAEPRVYALADPESGFWVYARAYSDTVLHVNGKPAQPREFSVQSDWWWTADEPKTLELVGPPTREVVGYDLPDGVSTPEGSPITVERWRELHDEDGDPIHQWVRLYCSVTEPREPKVTELPAPMMLVPGVPPAQADSRVWVAELPFELRERSEYRHLFPGHMPGFKTALKDYLGGPGWDRGQVPGVDCYDDRESRALSIRRTTSYEPTLTTTRKQPGRRKVQTVPRTVERRLLLLAPDSVKGRNRADAAERWDALWAKALELVGASNVKACGRCEGRGWLSDGPGANGERIVLWNEMGWAE